MVKSKFFTLSPLNTIFERCRSCFEIGWSLKETNIIGVSFNIRALKRKVGNIIIWYRIQYTYTASNNRDYYWHLVFKVSYILQHKSWLALLTYLIKASEESFFFSFLSLFRQKIVFSSMCLRKWFIAAIYRFIMIYLTNSNIKPGITAGKWEKLGLNFVRENKIFHVKFLILEWKDCMYIA